MRIIGCDLHVSQQTLAMLDSETGEVTEHALARDRQTVRAFYQALPEPVVVGEIEYAEACSDRRVADVRRPEECE